MKDDHHIDAELRKLVEERGLPDGAPHVKRSVLKEARRRAATPSRGVANVAPIVVTGILATAAALLLVFALPERSEAPSGNESTAMTPIASLSEIDNAAERLSTLRGRLERIRAGSYNAQTLRPVGELLSRTRKLRLEVADAAILDPTETKP